MTAPSATSLSADTRHAIFIIEDNPLMAECIARALSSYNVQIFPDAISATNALVDGLPDLVLLDVILNGPDGFTFLNEMISYSDTAQIPIILVTSLRLADQNLAHYGVRTILNKETMTPADICKAVGEALQKPVLNTQETASTKDPLYAR